MGYLNYLTSLVLLLFVDLNAGLARAEGLFEVQAFEASYEVYRKDKLTGKLNSQLKQIGPNTFQLTDVTKGTSGLASMLNFERTEITTFTYNQKQPEVISHSQKQQVAFRSRTFEFNHTPGTETYQGIYKNKPFSVNSPKNLLSSHLVPWQLAQQVCHQQNTFSLHLLKSNSPRTYDFKARAFDNNKIMIERLYPDSQNRRTATWVNHDKGCYVSEIKHYDNNEYIRTVLTDIAFVEQ